jgi:hypothetical protein
MQEPEEVTARPHRKIKLTPKAVGSSFWDPDTISDTSEDGGREAESAIHNLLGPGKDEDEELVENFCHRTGNAGKQKSVTPKGTADPDLEYQHLEDGVISDENDVRISDSESDSDDEVEGVLHNSIPITGSKNLYVNIIKSWFRSHLLTCSMGLWMASPSSQTSPGSTSDWRSLTNC